jgi:hypothetical protein
MGSQGELESWVLQMFLGSGLMVVMGLSVYYNYRKMIQNPDAQWDKHVDNLLAKGIDPSYIKRNSEWEAEQESEAKRMMRLGIIMGLIVPFITLTGTILTILSMWNEFDT